MYKERLANLGIRDPYVHSTRLREDLLVNLPDLYAAKSPARTIDLAFDEDVSQALQLMEEIRPLRL